MYIFINIYIYVYMCRHLFFLFFEVFRDRQGSEANLSVRVVFNEVKTCIFFCYLMVSCVEKGENYFAE